MSISNKVVEEIVNVIKEASSYKELVANKYFVRAFGSEHMLMNVVRRYIQYGSQRYDYWVSDWVMEFNRNSIYPITEKKLSELVEWCNRVKQETKEVVSSIKFASKWSGDARPLPF